MKIEELTSLENQLKSEMPKSGYFEDRDKYLHTHKLYDRWNNVFESYVLLAHRGNIEALKRALFFAWYQLAEPSQLSGIPQLTESSSKATFELVNELCENGDFDKELSWMLPYYLQVCDYYFERFEPLTNLRSVSEINSDLWQKESGHSSFINRGQLGEYWVDRNV